ncbi:MAG: hypothetical protein LBI84_01680 [Propionibacteriaceae bacterium]|nr:hypothetical protein [Propionibacteriaceae bacterium]
MPVTNVTAAAGNCAVDFTPDGSVIDAVRRAGAVLKRSWRFLAGALAVAALLELTLFNLPHWNSLQAGPEWRPGAADVILHDVEVDPVSGAYKATDKNASIELVNLDRPVYSLYLRPVFLNEAAVQSVELRYDDEDSTGRTAGSVRLIRDFDRSGYIAPILMGDVSRLVIRFNSSDVNADLAEIAVNKVIPLRFNGLRVVFAAGLAVACRLFAKGRLWRVRRRPGSASQRLLNTASVAGMAGFLGLGTVCTDVFGGDPGGVLQAWLTTNGPDHYSRLVDALLQGQVSLLEAPDPALAAAANPYDIGWRAGEGFWYLFDTAYYNGNYYIYFGIVPVLLLFLPFKVLTASYLAPRAAVFLFGAIAALFLYLFWSRFAARFLPNLPYAIFLAGAFLLFGGSQLAFLAWQPSDLEMPMAAGLAFSLAGLWLALKALDRLYGRTAYLALAATCLALAVGCRPTFVFSSALFAVLFWQALPPAAVKPDGKLAAVGAPRRLAVSRFESFWQGLGEGWSRLCGRLAANPGRLAAIAIPYAVVAAGLMAYNQVRFGSVVDFGASHQLTVTNVGAFADISLPGQIAKAGYGLFAYLFSPLDVQPTFPFVTVPTGANLDGFLGYYYVWKPIGMASIPAFWGIALAVWAWPELRRRQPLAARLVAVALVIAPVLMVVDAVGGGLHPRYEADFGWLVAFSALVFLAVASQALGRSAALRGPVRTAVAILLAGSAVIFLLIGVVSDFNWFEARNPAIYYRVVDFFKLW